MLVEQWRASSSAFSCTGMSAYQTEVVEARLPYWHSCVWACLLTRRKRWNPGFWFCIFAYGHVRLPDESCGIQASGSAFSCMGTSALDVLVERWRVSSSVFSCTGMSAYQTKAVEARLPVWHFRVWARPFTRRKLWNPGFRPGIFVYGHVRLLDGSHGSQDPCSAFSYMGTSTLSQMAQNEFLAYKAAE